LSGQFKSFLYDSSYKTPKAEGKKTMNRFSFDLRGVDTDSPSGGERKSSSFLHGIASHRSTKTLAQRMDSDDNIVITTPRNNVANVASLMLTAPMSGGRMPAHSIANTPKSNFVSTPNTADYSATSVSNISMLDVASSKTPNRVAVNVGFSNKGSST
jgi:hypothetical protein